jgi:hypothetical protein
MLSSLSLSPLHHDTLPLPAPTRTLQSRLGAIRSRRICAGGKGANKQRDMPQARNPTLTVVLERVLKEDAMQFYGGAVGEDFVCGLMM